MDYVCWANAWSQRIADCSDDSFTNQDPKPNHSLQHLFDLSMCYATSSAILKGVVVAVVVVVGSSSSSLLKGIYLLTWL